MKKLVEDQRAMVDVVFIEYYQTGYDENNPDELVFSYNIYNYGNTEAKNIEVECYIEDTNKEILRTDKMNYGNLASQSLDTDLLFTKNIDWNDKNGLYYASCYVINCEDCIILWERLKYGKELNLGGIIEK